MFTASEAEVGHKRVLRGMNRAVTAVNIQREPNNVHTSPTKSAVYVDGREGLPNEVGVMKRTSNLMNRQVCLGENETADRRAFESRV